MKDNFCSTDPEQQLVPDLSIVKVEAGSSDQEKHRLLEQEQVAADYKNSNPQQRSRSCESMDTGQQVTRSFEGNHHKKLGSVAALNEHLRFQPDMFIRRLSDNSQSNLHLDPKSPSDHRNFLMKLSHQGKHVLVICASIEE